MVEHGGAEVEPVHSGTHSSVEDQKDRSSQKLGDPGVGHIKDRPHPRVTCALHQDHPATAPQGLVCPSDATGQVRRLTGLYVTGSGSGGSREGGGLLQRQTHVQCPVHEPGVLTNLLALHQRGLLPQGLRECHPFGEPAAETVNEPQAEGGLPCVLPRPGYVKTLRHENLLPGIYPFGMLRS